MDPAGFDPFACPLEPCWFERPDGIHGISPTGRVLIHAQGIAEARDLDPEWFESIVLAAAWHDMGRTHDGWQPEHGANSGMKARRLGLSRSVHPHVLARVDHA